MDQKSFCPVVLASLRLPPGILTETLTLIVASLGWCEKRSPWKLALGMGGCAEYSTCLFCWTSGSTRIIQLATRHRSLLVVVTITGKVGLQSLRSLSFLHQCPLPVVRRSVRLQSGNLTCGFLSVLSPVRVVKVKSFRLSHCRLQKLCRSLICLNAF